MKKPKIKLKMTGKNAGIQSFYMDDVLSMVEDRQRYMKKNKKKKKK